ncbi:MAG TPA: hypothetical protein ENI57_12380 [Ignavibacteria bacterium]|nr:hypothetical protein [Ignavibacteria bacterium]
MNTKSFRNYFKTFLTISVILFSTLSFAQIDTSLFKGVSARSIGPAGMSGRIASIDAVVSNPNIIYVGTATGGVWKSVDGGTTWKPIFDKEPVSSIGAVAIYQANPSIVWVGTGESNIRNSAGVGRGVYKSLDGGKTWIDLGLKKTETISKILLDPTNPDVAYVGALGTNWGATKERGLYKTTDGGKTWKKILFVNNETGVGDMVMDPNNPNKLIVSMWQHHRWPWFFKSGGPGSGVYMTVNGGENWKKLTSKDGFPEGELGKVGLAIAPGRTNIVYALVEAKKSVLLRSEDGGYKWKVVNKKKGVNVRPFYFGRIAVNPVNENIVYRIEFNLRASEDGGKTFKRIQDNIHVDNHAFWIHPNGEYIISGNDGGIAISHDRGNTWRFVTNLPLAQFYHIAVDNAIPYNVYGGLQDNGSWRGPNTSFSGGSIYNFSWQKIGGGDGFDTRPDPDNSNAGYSMSQDGWLGYYNLDTKNRRTIKPTVSDVKDRYNWNAALAIDPFNSSTIYYGSQFVHKSTDKGLTWTIISPDLTTNDSTKQKQAESGGLTRDVTGAENYTTIISISPSRVKQGVIWVGTDDGNIQVTKDGGKTWNKVSNYLIKKKMMPKFVWIPRVKASKHDAGTAYVVANDYRRNNWKKYVFVTRNYGKTWKNIAKKNIDGFVRTIVEDPVDKNLLFLGTEMGLYYTIDAGKNWTKWTNNFPTAPVFGLKIQERESDLVIGTYGRGIYIIDDISPLRELSKNLLKKKSHLFQVNDAYLYRFYSTGEPPTYGAGSTAFRGKNRKYGAFFTYYLDLPDSLKKLEGTKKEKKAVVKIMKNDSTVIRTYKAKMTNGINRITWDLREKAFKSPLSKNRHGEEIGGLSVLPGTYIVQITAGDQKLSSKFEVKPDPRFKYDEPVAKKNYEFNVKIGKLTEKVADAYKQIGKTLKSIRAFNSLSKNMDSTKTKELKKEAKELKKEIVKLRNKLVPDKDRTGYWDNSGILMSRLGNLRRINYHVSGLPGQNAVVEFEHVIKLSEKLFKEYNNLYETKVKHFQDTVAKSGFTIFNKFKEIK